ncbi:MAG: AAA family ATPase [Deltaproteobacteria bacterium]|nr:AAA family ATPase [Deltaproteobacteria bacterium]
MAYEQFFGLKDTPFRLTPDPAYYFPSDVHKEALQTLLYSIRAGEGFVQITGEPGTGKTLILRTILQQLGDEVTTALILNPRLSPSELLRVILEDLGLDPLQMEKKSKEALLRYFRDMLLEKARKGVKTVVIIDEAQNLPNDTMEELRLLSNLETEKEKLLQIILVGQIELEKKLKSPDLKQLAQRITIRYRLKPLSKNDTIAYIYHRISVAGGGELIRFSPMVLDRIHKLSKGVPRLINIICERALMAAFVEGKNTIKKGQVRKAMESIAGEKEETMVWLPRKSYIAAFALTAIIAVAIGWYQYSLFHPEKGFFRLELSKSNMAALQKKEATLNEKERKMAALIDEKKALSRKEAVLTEKEAGLDQKTMILEKKEEGLLEKEDDLASKEELLVEKEAVTADQDSLTLTLAPASLAENFYLPPDNFFVILDCSTNKASIWKGTDSKPLLKDEIEYEWPLGEGLFVVGSDSKKGDFVFYHMSFFWSGTSVVDTNFWGKIAPLVSGKSVPLVAYSSRDHLSKTEKTGISMAEQSREIRQTIADWADAWRRMDVDSLIDFYGNIFTCYYLDMDKLLVFTREHFYRIKKEILDKSEFVSLKISDPICIINPEDPRIAIAVFNQKYRSSIYADEGTKAFYFILVDEPDGKQTWKIVAKLWLPR